MRSSVKTFVSIILCLSLLLSVLTTSTVAEDAVEKPQLKILAIGNSYSNNSTELISAIADSMGTGLDITAASLYQAGCPLKRHVQYYEAYETLGKDGYYAKENKSKYEYLTVNGVANKNILSIQEAIAYTDWDYITIQQMPDFCDDITSYYTEEQPDVTKLYNYILDELKENENTKCEILFHQGWSFSHAMSIDNAYGYYPVDYNNTKEFFTAIESTVNEAVNILKDKCGLEMAPELVLSGKAVQLAKDEFGFGDSWGEETSLYADNISHLSYVGRYLVGCVWIETFAAKAGLPITDTRTASYVPVDKGVTEEMAVLLRSCAHEAVTGESDTIYGDWRAIPYEDGLKITHYVGEVPATGTVTIPALIGDEPVLCVGKTAFKYVDGVTGVLTVSNSVEVEDGAFDGIKVLPTFWDGTSVKPEGEGTQEKPYLITNAAELHYAIGTMTGTNYKNSYFKLTNDIYVNDISVDAVNGTVYGADTARQWFPANATTQHATGNLFCGILDGDNHVIYGLYLNQEYTGGASDWNTGRGLIPRGACTVKNLGIENSYLNAPGTAVSAFIGTNNNSSLPIIFENSYVGEDVYLSGSCVGGFWAGGSADSSANKFTNCYGLATLNSTTSFWGGIAGQVWSGGKDPVVNCYTNTRLYGQNTFLFENCFETVDKYTNGTTGCKILTAENMQGELSASKMSSLYKAYVVTDTYPILRSFSSRNNGEWSGFRVSTMDGSGTETDPWLVANAENLAYIAFGSSASGKYYKLICDIYLNNIEKIDFSTSTVDLDYDAVSWQNNYTFSGNFDGNGHTVYGIWYPKGNNAGSTTIQSVGLFGRPISGSSIKNVAVRHAYIESVGQCGAIAGFITGQTTSPILIDSCYSDDTVYVVSKRSEKIVNDVSSSGILGGVLSSTAQITISNCMTTANLSSQNVANKIIASIWKGSDLTLDSCYADGSLCTGSNGSNLASLITNCYSPAASDSYKTWNTIQVEAMTGAKALDRMPELGDAYIAVAKDYPALKIFAKDAEEPDKSFWDGSYVKPSKGSGTEADPFLITNEEEFAYIVYSGGAANAHYKLTTDIYLNRLDKIEWATGKLLDENYPVNEWFTGYSSGGGDYYNGLDNIKFSGYVDGDGYAVHGMYYAPGQPGTVSGLFPVISSATVKNLAIKDSFAASGRWAGVLAGFVSGAFTVDKVLIDDTVKVLTYNAGNYHYDGSLKDDRINAASPFAGVAAQSVKFESCAAGGFSGFIGTSATCTITNSASYAEYDGTSCQAQYANPYSNGGNPIRVGNNGTIFGLFGTCWNPKALNFSNCITNVIPVANSDGIYGTPNFTMSGVYNASGVDSTRSGVVNIEEPAKFVGPTALSLAPELSKDVWYAVDNAGKMPSLRVIGTTMGDVDEDTEFTLKDDSAALRVVIIKNSSPSNGDYNKDGVVDIVDLVALWAK